MSEYELSKYDGALRTVVSVWAGILTALVVGALMGTTEVATADVIYVANNPPIYGRLVTQDQARIAFRQRMSEGHYVDRTFRREDVEAVIVTIDEQRLSSLDPNRPQDYRDLAEELAIKRRDPEARDLAIRLYLLTAYLGHGQDRRSGFLGLISLARNPSERKRSAALAFLEDSQHDPAWLAHATRADAADSASRQSRRDLLAALRDLRRGRPLVAVETIKGDSVKSIMEEYKAIYTWGELYQSCLAGELTFKQLERVLALELAVLESLDTSRGAHPPVLPSWADLVQRTPDAVHWVQFDNVTEFDPRQTVFRDGQWTTGEEK